MKLMTKKVESDYTAQSYNVNANTRTLKTARQNGDVYEYESIDYSKYNDADFQKDMISEYKQQSNVRQREQKAKAKAETQGRIYNEVPELVKYIESHNFSDEDKAVVKESVENLQLALDAGYYSDVNDFIDYLSIVVEQDKTKALLDSSSVDSYISRMQSALNNSEYDIDPQIRDQMQQLINVYANVDETCGYDNVKLYTDTVKEFYDAVGQQAIVYAINKKDYKPQTKESFYSYIIDKLSDGMVKAGDLVGINDFVATSKVVDLYTTAIATEYNLAMEVNKQNLQILEGAYDSVLSAARFLPGVNREALKEEISKDRSGIILDWFDPEGEYAAIADANALRGFTSDGQLTKLGGGLYRVGAIIAIGKVAGAKLGPVAGAKVASGIQLTTAATNAYSQALQEGYNKNSVVLDIGGKDTKIKVDYSKYLEIRDLDKGDKTTFSTVETTDEKGNKVTLELSIRRKDDGNYEVTDQYGRKYNYSSLEQYDTLQAEARAIAYGGFEVLQWYLGKKNNDLFKTKVGGKYVDLRENVIGNVLKRTGLDILDAAVETPIRSLIDYTYDDDLTFKQAWEKQGGFSGLLIQAGIGGIFSISLETFTNDVFRGALKEVASDFMSDNTGSFTIGFKKKPVVQDPNLDIQKYQEIQDAWKVNEAVMASNYNVDQNIQNLCRENPWLRDIMIAERNGIPASLTSPHQVEVYNQYKSLQAVRANNMQSLEIANTVLTGSEEILNNGMKKYIISNNIDIDSLTDANKRAVYDMLKNQNEIGAFIDYDTFLKNHVDIIAGAFDEQAVNNDLFGRYFTNKNGVESQLKIINAAEDEIARLRKMSDGWLDQAILDSQKLGRVSIFGDEQADIYSKYAAAKASQENAYQQLMKIQSTNGYDSEMVRYMQKNGIDPTMLSDEYKRALLNNAVASGLVDGAGTTFDDFMAQYNAIKKINTTGRAIFNHDMGLTEKMLGQLDEATRKSARIFVVDTLNSDDLDALRKPIYNINVSVEEMQGILKSMNLDVSSFDGLDASEIARRLKNWTSYDSLLSNKELASKVLDTLPKEDVLMILEHTRDNSLIAQAYEGLPEATRQYLKQNMEFSLGYDLATKYGIGELYNPEAADLINFKNQIADMYQQKFPGIFDIDKIKADTSKIFFYNNERFATMTDNPRWMAYNNQYSESIINMGYGTDVLKNNIDHELVHAAARDTITGSTGFSDYNTALNECSTEYINKLLMGNNYYTAQTGEVYCGYQHGSDRFSDILRVAGISNEQFAAFYNARDAVGLKNAVDGSCGAGFFDMTTQLLEIAIGPDVSASEDAIGQLYGMIRSVYAGR